MNFGFLKRGGHGVNASFVIEVLNHKEVKVQEGQIDRRDINHGSLIGSTFTRIKTLKTVKDVVSGSS